MTETTGRVLVRLERAALALTPALVASIEQRATRLPLRVPTIEPAGGSGHCMIAEIQLTAR